MDATTLNTIISIGNTVVGVIGIITGTIGVICIKKSHNVIKKMTASNVSGSVQQANQIIYNGASVKDIEHIAERVASERGKQQITAITRVEDIEKLIVSNPKYSIPLVWNGTQEEYDKLNANNEVISNAFYMISD